MYQSYAHTHNQKTAYNKEKKDFQRGISGHLLWPHYEKCVKTYCYRWTDLWNENTLWKIEGISVTCLQSQEWSASIQSSFTTFAEGDSGEQSRRSKPFFLYFAKIHSPHHDLNQSASFLQIKRFTNTVHTIVDSFLISVYLLIISGYVWHWLAVLT